jgi:hypothetical protein
MRRIKRVHQNLTFFLAVLIISCTKDANIVVTTPPSVDSSAMVTSTGTFQNGPYGSVTGNVEILKQDSGYILRLKNFSSSSGPDLHVYLSKEVQPQHFIDLGSLRSRTGDQAYSIPGNSDFSKYRYASIHCQAYNHLFGSAQFQ